MRLRVGVVTALCVVVTLGVVAGWFVWWEQRDKKNWTIDVTNERNAELLVGGVSGGMSIATGYAIVEPHASTRAVVSHHGSPPDAIVFDFESHNGSDGELIVVPSWQATKRPFSCSWDEVQRYAPLVVTDETASCADLARP